MSMEFATYDFIAAADAIQCGDPKMSSSFKTSFLLQCSTELDEKLGVKTSK